MNAAAVKETEEAVWTGPDEEGYSYQELLRQEYAGNNCIFSGGFVKGHPVDTMYLKWEKDGDPEVHLFMFRPDEVAAISWIATGILWSDHIDRLHEQNGEGA